jgi:DNA-binding transcriptional ArsR family regulator
MMGPPHGLDVGKPRQGPVDYHSLAEFLTALGYAPRLELLDALRFPHTLAEIRLSPQKLEPGGNPDRPSSKPTIRGHLHKLVEAGLVRVEEVEQQGKLVPSYEANPQKLYALTEDLRRLTTRYGGLGPGKDATGTLAGQAERKEARGPRLVLVHGVYEGKVFPLEEATAQAGAWLVGRREGLAVSLDYDPYVSLENAAITRREGAYRVADLKASKNGTSVNWAPLARGGQRALESGDIIGVGRSMLVFRER